MISKLKNISLTQWMMISMVLGLIVGLALNLCVEDSFVKNTILMDNIFYIGGNGFIKLIKMMIIPLVFCSIVVGVSSISDVKTLGKIGGNTILLYLITTAIAIITGGRNICLNFKDVLVNRQNATLLLNTKKGMVKTIISKSTCAPYSFSINGYPIFP